MKYEARSLTKKKPLGSLFLWPFPPSTRLVSMLFLLGTLPLPWARTWSLATCAHASVPIESTPAPCTTLAWMKDDFPRRRFTEAEALVDEPLVDDQLTSRHRPLQPSLSPSCPVFWPQSPSNLPTRTPSNSLTCIKLAPYISHVRHHVVGDRYPHLAYFLDPLLARRRFDQLATWALRAGPVLLAGGDALLLRAFLPPSLLHPSPTFCTAVPRFFLSDVTEGDGRKERLSFAAIVSRFPLGFRQHRSP